MLFVQGELKQQFLVTLQSVLSEYGGTSGAPVTNLKLPAKVVQEIEAMVIQLEAINPNYRPLLFNPKLLDGAWLLLYSTAREIRNLASLPLGLKVGKIYQVIDVDSQSFFNQAFVRHPLGFISGEVKVTARFEAVVDDRNLPDKRLNVYFQKRYIAIDNILGVKTPNLNPARVVPARNPVGRIPSLDITYLDETLRIGRGGEGSLFVLQRSQKI
ncbi:PAP/fibrillin family protein [Limnoraphis robusta Tam1]|uniref:PAP/fibrillin family protein n=1 Tax=Limnoraphis robusta CCNP1315 TaxID=3110306 RepID=A0ABU5TTK6_9CYAN|nr:PAP/fibrillin family protein [Limnoraphis robusta]MEA5499348.1 PAP/fibrillin family protein [Limnoraphis robusta BA-68 BA1]MEA5518022.1 PAP/fibrillin family protein [Limnoraphis robusta CCNP1315]MEA5539327.1 PAP/fibrillin family protein [Limnoraphis robusta Tam1]MEA5547249.1 PAP/fibrillin family protein [Limnoraphis robusta CCNP1324]